MALQVEAARFWDPGVSIPGRLNLIAVLDWGLGHASRSLALANRLRQSGERVCWASAGQSLAMIKKETQGEIYYELPPYDIRYPTRSMSWNILIQSGRILKVIRKERLAIEKVLLDSGADRLISDSRFGCRSDRVTSIFLSHQLQPIIPKVVGWLYRSWIEPFDAYWVPDEAHENRLSGRLSDGGNLGEIYYLGYLSRIDERRDNYSDSLYLEKSDERNNQPTSECRRHQKGKKHNWQVCVLLSGPEPQRTKLEVELLELLAQLSGQHWLIRGLPEGKNIAVPENIRLTQYANSAQLKMAIAGAKLLICRSGYSTLMDLGVANRTSVLLVPTPGQTEQEYLAQRAVEVGWSSSAKQGKISLEMIQELLAFS
ncbi:MAG: glycosyltransferase [Bacteroidota bacterium]